MGGASSALPTLPTFSSISEKKARPKSADDDSEPPAATQKKKSISTSTATSTPSSTVPPASTLGFLGKSPFNFNKNIYHFDPNSTPPPTFQLYDLSYPLQKIYQATPNTPTALDAHNTKNDSVTSEDNANGLLDYGFFGAIYKGKRVYSNMDQRERIDFKLKQSITGTCGGSSNYDLSNSGIVKPGKEEEDYLKVLKSYEDDDEAPVAIKIIPRKKTGNANATSIRSTTGITYYNKSAQQRTTIFNRDKGLTPTDIAVANEILSLKNLTHGAGHSNIQRLVSFRCTTSSYIIVLPYCQYGELFDLLSCGISPEYGDDGKRIDSNGGSSGSGSIVNAKGEIDNGVFGQDQGSNGDDDGNNDGAGIVFKNSDDREEVKPQLRPHQQYNKSKYLPYKPNLPFVYTELGGLQIFNQILAGVLYMHSKGIVHRDLKAENLLIYYEAGNGSGEGDEGGGFVIRISDFGRSCALTTEDDDDSYYHQKNETDRDESSSCDPSSSYSDKYDCSDGEPLKFKPNLKSPITLPLVKVGTVGYTAPELMNGHMTDDYLANTYINYKSYNTDEVDDDTHDSNNEVYDLPDCYNYPVDIFSLGVILYILLVGFPPFDEFAVQIAAINDDEDDNDENGGVTQPSSSSNFDQDASNGNGANSNEKRYCALDFPSPFWNDTSPSAITLIKKMLTFDPALRISGADVDQSYWVTEGRRVCDMDEREVSIDDKMKEHLSGHNSSEWRRVKENQATRYKSNFQQLSKTEIDQDSEDRKSELKKFRDKMKLPRQGTIDLLKLWNDERKGMKGVANTLMAVAKFKQILKKKKSKKKL